MSKTYWFRCCCDQAFFQVVTKWDSMQTTMMPAEWMEYVLLHQNVVAFVVRANVIDAMNAILDVILTQCLDQISMCSALADDDGDDDVDAIVVYLKDLSKKPPLVGYFVLLHYY